MEWGLLLSAAALGVLGWPHCAAMCAAPCAALSGGQQGRGAIGFQLARASGYAAFGAALGGGGGAIGAWAAATPGLQEALRGLWVMLHAAALGLGLWWLLRGQHPRAVLQWLQSRRIALWLGRGVTASTTGPTRLMAPGAVALTWVGAAPAAEPRLRQAWPWRSLAGGSLWWAWPCGLLHAALVLATLSGSAARGAGLMLAFALASAPALWLGQRGWRWLRSGGGASAAWALRLAGALLVVSATFALWQDASGQGLGSLCWGP
jgi:uncharacterized protein